VATPSRLPARCAASRYPKALPGESIGVIAPAGPARSLAPIRFTRGVERLRSWGYRPVVGAHAAAEEPCPSPRQRAADINDFVRDRDVTAMIAAIGGWNANATLRWIDWDAWAENPTAIVGYSDITALLLSAFSMTGMVTLHGPTVMPELAELPAPLSETTSSFLDALNPVAPELHLRPAPQWCEEFVPWDQETAHGRLRCPGSKWTWSGSGSAAGRLVGGNLETIPVLAGTRYLPDLAGAVFFWETTATTLGPVARTFDYFDELGILDEVAAVIVGRSFRAGPAFEVQLRNWVRERFSRRRIPVVSGVEIGHGDPMWTLPIGVPAVIDADRQTIVIHRPADSTTNERFCGVPGSAR
jgi:muramoyltetrapeptide carboxypeptidase